MKKKMKSALSLFLALVMLLTVAQIGVSATTDQMTISAAEKTAFPGTTVDVEVTLKDNPGVSSIGLDVGYNKSILSLEKIVYNTAMGGTTQSSSLNDNPATLLWVNSAADFESDATFATLTFKVNASAKDGDSSDITLSFDEDNIYNLEENNISTKTINGKVTVTTVLAGDINNDSKVNNKDVSRLMQYLAHWEVEVNTLVLDTNGDNKINNKDVSRLMQWLAHWDVDLHPTPEDMGQMEPNPDCEHNLKKVDAVAATCKKEGHKAYYECTLCGKKFNDFLGAAEATDEELVIPKLAHTVVVDPAVAPTPTSEGRTEGSHCSVCGEVIVAPEPIPVISGEAYSITYHPYAGDDYLMKIGINNPNQNYYETAKGLKLQNINNVEGYIFDGWYDGEGANGELVKTIPAGTTGDLELYAKWTPRTYTITFNSPLVPVQDRTYKVNTGATWTNPSLNGYNFIGWCDENNKLVTSIPVGSTGNKTLYANWTSKRNQTRPVSRLDDPIIMEDTDKGNIMFAYEIGTIENVPLQAASPTYQSVGGMKQTFSTQESVTVTEGEAKNIAKTVSNSTSDSRAWSLSENWNDVTSVSDSYATKKGWSKEEAEQYSKTASDTYSINSSSGGSMTQTTSNGLSGTLSRSNSVTDGESNTRERETGSEFEINGKYHRDKEDSAEIGLTAALDDIIGASAKLGQKIARGFEIGASYSNYDKNKTSQTISHSKTGTAGGSLTLSKSNATSGTSTWNTSEGYSSSLTTSQMQSVRSVLSEEISTQKTYGSSYARGGSKSDTQQFTNSSAESDQYSSSITFSKGSTSIETKTIELGGDNEGYYRFVLAGMAHVFAVVGYDVSTSAYYTFTYTVMDDDTYTFIDYSKDTAAFNDNENGVLPFEVPYFVKEYVDARLLQTDGLSVSQEGVVTGYNGADDVVFVPSYYRMDNLDGTHTSIKITGISSNAFAGKDVKAVSLSNFITEIPNGAFKNCTDLEVVSCPGVTKIQANAFKGCESLLEFELDSNIEVLGSRAFDGVKKLSLETGSKEVAKGAIDSGAKQVVLNISKNPEAMEGTEFIVPASIDSFELRGNAKDYKNIKVKSDAKTTIINGLNITSTSGTPFNISSENVIFNRLNVDCRGFAAILKNDETNLKLYGSVKLNSESGKAIVCRNLSLSEVDPAISSSMAVTGNVYICGDIEGQKFLSITNGNIIKISEEEFEKYAQGCYEITFDANSGEVATNTMTVYYGNEYGELPVATRDYYTFTGWFTEAEGGTQVTKDTIFEGSADMTLYAHWADNPTSDWVIAAESPADAKIVAEKWSYDKTLYTTSSSSTMTGWEKYNETWKWSDWSGWSNWSTNPINGSDTVQVETKWVPHYKTQYNYSKWSQYSNGTGKNGPSKRSWGGVDCNYYFERGWTDSALAVCDTSQGFNIYGKLGVDPWYNETIRQVENGGHTEYRYRTRYKIYTYYFEKTEQKESDTEIEPYTNTNEKVDNVQKWVKYINKSETGSGSWSDWSKWQTTEVEASDTVQVETKWVPHYKTQYNYCKWSQNSDGTGKNGPTQGTWGGVVCNYYFERGWTDSALAVCDTTQGFEIFGTMGVDPWYNQTTRAAEDGGHTEYRFRTFS